MYIWGFVYLNWINARSVLSASQSDLSSKSYVSRHIILLPESGNIVFKESLFYHLTILKYRMN